MQYGETVINKLLKNEFNSNVLTLMTGTTIAQAIPVAISPILTRIYTPEDFGVYALFIAIASIFGSISNARYELAIMLPESDEDAFNIAALGMMICVSMSIVLLLVFFIFNEPIAQKLGNDNIGVWLYFVPIAVFFMGLFNVLNYLNIRIKNYKDIARVTIYKSIIIAVVQLSVGLLKSGAAGLISGQLMSHIFANYRLLKNIMLQVDVKKIVSFSLMKKLAIQYQDFPRYSLMAVLANTLSQHLTSILISVIYSVSTLGFYSLGNRILGMPSSLIGSSVGQVFFQAASKEKQETGKAVKTFNSTLKKLVLISLPSFGVLFFIVEDLFAFVFGEDWRIAGVYAKIMVPLFCVRFVVSPLTLMNQVNLKNKLGMNWQLGLLFLYLTILFISAELQIEFEKTLKILSFTISFYYLFFLFLIRRHTRG